MAESNEYLIQKETLVSIANETRILSGTAGEMSPERITDVIHTENNNFRTNISAQDTLIAQIQAALEGKAGGSGGITPEGTITITENGTHNVTSYALANVALPETEQATPDISVDSNGLITASVTQTAGYVFAGTKSSAKQLTTQAAKTVTPSTSSQIAVASGRYTTGAITVAGDADLIAGNIKKGVTIFNVTGSFEGLPSRITKLTTGTLTPASDETSSRTIKHGLGAEPDFIMIMIKDVNVSSDNYYQYLLCQSLYRMNYTRNGSEYTMLGDLVIGNSSNSNNFQTNIVSLYGSSNPTYFAVYASSDCKLKAGETYCWVAGIFENI